jgi:SAM-dependent methyltransferase
VTRYDTIGRSYASTRRTDPRIAAPIYAALGDARSVVNVGAGTGNYEGPQFDLVAVEPSRTMIKQRAEGAAPCVQGAAESLPFRDGVFDAALTVLSAHHWHDLETGLREMQRVSTNQVVFFFEPWCADQFWLVADYFPHIPQMPTERRAPGEARFRELLPVQRVETVPVPADCLDGFGGCYWNRPERYLDTDVQAGMSCFAQMETALLDQGMARLRRELTDGTWDAKYGDLRSQADVDLGYRVLVAQ